MSDIDCLSASRCVAVTGRGETVVGTPAGPKTLTVDKVGGGTVTSAPAGINCGTACSTTVADGTTVTLTATAASGARFAGWSGACSGTSGPCQVDVVDATSVTATFVATAALTVSKAGSGAGTVTSAPAGIDCGATCSFTYDQGAKVTLTAAAAGGSDFTGWSGACTGTAACEVTLAAARTVTATFARNRSLKVDTWNGGSGYGKVTSPAGVDCDFVCDYARLEGATLTLTATPEPGSRFAGWSGVACPGTGTCTVTLNTDMTVVARFVLTSTLTVTKTGSGAGSVVSGAGDITCGATCSAVYDAGTNVTLTATPAAGSAFIGWSGGDCSGTGPCTTTVDDSRTVTATFATKPTLAVATSGTGTGTVTSAAAGIDCGAACTAELDPGATVTLTASPATGSTFTGWSGGGCSGTQPCQVKVDDATTVTATFTVNPPPTATPAATATATATPPPAQAEPPAVLPGPQPTPSPTATAPETRLGKQAVNARSGPRRSASAPPARPPASAAR